MKAPTKIKGKEPPPPKEPVDQDDAVKPIFMHLPLKIDPQNVMTLSQMNLLNYTTPAGLLGTINGDIYTKFLYGQLKGVKATIDRKTLDAAAQKIILPRFNKIIEDSMEKKNSFTVGPAPPPQVIGGKKKSKEEEEEKEKEKELMRLRRKYPEKFRKLYRKEQGKVYVAQNWQKLLEIRTGIVSCIHSLKMYYNECYDQETENLALSQLYKKTKTEVNDLISTKIKQNKKYDNEFIQLYKEYLSNRQSNAQALILLDKELEFVGNSYDKKILSLEQEIEQTQNENQELLRFKTQLETNPEYLLNELTNLRTSFRNITDQEEKKMTNLTEKSLLDMREIENAKREKVAEIGTFWGKKLSKFTSHSIIHYNEELKTSLRVKEKQLKMIEGEVKELEGDRVRLLDGLKELKKDGKEDIRRRALNLKKFMDCDPDMNVFPTVKIEDDDD